MRVCRMRKGIVVNVGAVDRQRLCDLREVYSLNMGYGRQ
jgi:hypothetical protein